MVEFDCPFTVDENGNIHDSDEYAPTLWDESLDSDRWVFWSTGYSGQDSYSGPIMHNSEYLGGRMARDLLAEPGTYCLVVAYWSPDDEDQDDDDTAEGWAVVKLSE
jgi:hypothetical protein